MNIEGQKNYITAMTVVTLILFSSGALASTVTYVTAITSASSPGSSDNDSVLQEIGTSAGYSAAADLASATTSVTMGFGWARVSAVAAAGGEDAHGSAAGQGMWVDDLTISAPGLTGSGVATVSFDVSGNLSASSGGSISGSNADATWNLFFKSGNVTQSFVGRGRFHASPGSSFTEGDINGGTYSVDFDFSFDNPIQVTVALNAEADADHSGNATARFENTLEWAGITELRDNSGNLVSDFSISGGSGVDWEHAVSAPAIVPVPAGFWLLISGLVSLIPAFRRR